MVAAPRRAVLDREPEHRLHDGAREGVVGPGDRGDPVDVPAHGEAVLEPGGLHIMLIGLKAPLEEGKSFALTLEFDNAGEIEVVTTIEDIAHASGGGHEHGHGN